MHDTHYKTNRFGWIKLHRKLSENQFWTCEPFTRGQAWIDLLLLANYEHGFIYVRGNKIDIERGQVGWSQKRLAERWQWSRSKVRKFLSDLENEQQIIQQKNAVTTVVSILNYDEYQKNEQQNEQQKDSSETTEGQQRDTKKKNKEEIRIEGHSKIPTRREVESYFEEHAEKMLSEDIQLEAGKFINHFEERSWKNSSGKKIKNWHRQAATWYANYQQYHSKRIIEHENNEIPERANAGAYQEWN